VVEPEPRPEEKPAEVLPAQPAAPVAKEVPAPEPVLRPMLTEGSKNYSEEERALLDEKINLIIKKYQRKRRQKTFWTILLVTLGVAVVGFLGYCLAFYFINDPHILPFGIPVFWE